MRHRISFVVFVAAVVLATTLTPAIAEEPPDRSFLWRVEHEGRTVHLLGSIHFMKKDAYPLSPVIENAYESAELLIFETDMDGMGKAAIALMTAGALDKDRTLADEIGSELYRRTSQRFESIGMDIGAFDRMKPWMVALSLTSMELMRSGYLGSEGIDAHFNARAKADGKQRLGLETPEFQVSLFADLTDDESREFLEVTLDDLESVIPMVEDIVASWTDGDADAVQELLAEGFEEHPELFAKMVTDRNLNWLPEIEKSLQGGADALVVVGSLHLVGDEGLVELLRARGYKVEQR